MNWEGEAGKDTIQSSPVVCPGPGRGSPVFRSVWESSVPALDSGHFLGRSSLVLCMLGIL